MPILTVENLSKSYGRIQALNKVTFSVPEGSVFGILGPNGSGKTTMLGTIMDILKPTTGSYKLFDEVPSDKHRRRIGTLLETPNFYHYLSGVKNLEIAAEIKQHGKEDIPRVGGKGANLGEMYQAHFPVPNGYIVSSQAYFAFIKQNNLTQKIKDQLSTVNFNRRLA